MSTLARNTIVTHPKTGDPVTLLAEDELPDWAVGLVGKHLLEGEQDDDQTEDVEGPRPDDGLPVTRGWMRQFMAELIERQDESAAELGDDELPPTSGKGSGVEAWQKYADDHGIAYPEGAGRDEIVAAVEAHRADQQ